MLLPFTPRSNLFFFSSSMDEFYEEYPRPINYPYESSYIDVNTHGVIVWELKKN
jgi:hypothetical protein